MRGLLLASVLLLSAAPAAAQCVNSATTWKSSSFPAQSGVFEATFTAAPAAARIDAVTGLSRGAPTGFTSLAVGVRFNNAGYIDARNGAVYAADAQIAYTPGAVYRFRVRVDTAARRFSVWVTPPGAAERALAVNYAFRTEQAGASSLDRVGFVATSGAHQVCAVSVSGGGPDGVPPTVSLTAPSAGSALSGSVQLSAAATDNIGVAGVQFLVDGAPLGAESVQPPFATTWNTLASAAGAHTLTAIARDAAGNRTTSAPIAVTVNNLSGGPPSGCEAASNAWKSGSFAAQTAPFSATFDAIPEIARMDGTIGVAPAAATSYAGLAAIVRFNTAGYIDARNGGAYAAATQVPYSAGARYRFRLVIDPSSKRYSAYVTPPGTAERVLGVNYAFRPEQASASRLAAWSAFASAGTVDVCGFVAGAAPPPPADSAPPTVSFTSPGSGATVSGSVSLSVSAADNVGVSGVQFSVDGTSLGAEVVNPPFALAWNTTAVGNGSHQVTATARDAAGNRGSASVTVNVNNQAPGNSGVDRFGVKRLYPTLTGGKNWAANWDNGVARNLTSGQVDPYDPWYRARGSAQYRVDGAGLMTVSGATVRQYVQEPSLNNGWRNVEITIYGKRVADSGTAYAGIVCVTRTNHSAYGASETVNGCDSRGTGARFRLDGHIDFEKETKHPTSIARSNKAIWSTMPYNTWIGYKLVVYDLPNGNVKFEHYMDLTDGANGGTWNKVNELEDNGSNHGVGGTPCAAGMDPAIRLTASNTRPGSETGRPNIATYCRTDNVGTNGMVYKKWTIREIAAP